MPTTRTVADRRRTVTRAKVLVALGAGDLDGSTARQVAERIELGRTAATGWLIELMRDGLVRQRDDHPPAIWQLTNAGERQYFRARRVLRDEGWLTFADVNVA